ncbi:MAG: hypothetical protein QOJ81_2260 [Chloroflexota bacterium]|jgi:hypothetical protein|nr:hypothetical protein [Chloroflexota bacterium]
MTPRSRLCLKLLLVLSLVLLAPSDCTIDVGNLGDFVVTHDVIVTNVGTEDASVWIIGGGTKRHGALKPGGTLAATLFSGASVLISVSPARDQLAELKAKRDAISAQLAQQPLSLAGSLEIYRQLDSISSAIRLYEQTGHGQLCAADLKTDSKGRGNDVTGSVTQDGGDFKISCQ